MVVGIFGVDAALDGCASPFDLLLSLPAVFRPPRFRFASEPGRRPVTNSVTGCSTCSRVFISRK